MQLGATKHWREAMEKATGDKRLSSKGVMEYFGPLYVWLKNRNKELDVLGGWDDKPSKYLALKEHSFTKKLFVCYFLYLQIVVTTNKTNCCMQRFPSVNN